MSDFELVSGLFDAAIYLVVLLVGIGLWWLGRRRAWAGLEVLGLCIGLFALVAAIVAGYHFFSEVGATRSNSTTATTEPTPTTLRKCGPWEEPPTSISSDWSWLHSDAARACWKEPPTSIPDAARAWCKGSDVNRVQVFITAGVLDLHDFDLVPFRKYVAGTASTKDVDLINEETTEWRKTPTYVLDFERACVAAYEAFR